MRGVVVVVLCACGVAFADPSAASHYKQGKAFFEARQYDQAIAEYLAAYALDKLPAHLYNIGRAYRLAGNAKLAIEYFQRFLDVAPNSPLAKEIREDIVRATQELVEQAAKVDAERKRLIIESHVNRARAFADSGQWNQAGDQHRAAFDVDGDPSHLRDAGDAYVNVPDVPKALDAYNAYLDRAPQAGDSNAVREKIAKLSKPRPPPTPAVNPEPPQVYVAPASDTSQRSLKRRVLALGIAGTGVVMAGVGGFYGLSARSKWRDAQTLGCDNEGTCPTQAGVDLATDARSRGTLGTVFVIGGVAAIGAGALLFWTAPRRADRIAIAPDVSRGVGGILVRGSF